LHHSARRLLERGSRRPAVRERVRSRPGSARDARPQRRSGTSWQRSARASALHSGGPLAASRRTSVPAPTTWWRSACAKSGRRSGRRQPVCCRASSNTWAVGNDQAEGRQSVRSGARRERGHARTST
jgi:hypothetical protein